MHPVIVRQKAQRRSYLKRFSSEIVHIKAAKPLASPEIGLTKRGVKMEDRFYTFALKARNKAAQSTLTPSGVHHDLVSIAHPRRVMVNNVTPKEDAEHMVILESTTHNQIRYYFEGRVHYLVEVLASFLHKKVTTRRSIIYGSRDSMIRAMELHNIYWEETKEEGFPAGS